MIVSNYRGLMKTGTFQRLQLTNPPSQLQSQQFRRETTKCVLVQYLQVILIRTSKYMDLETLY